MAPETPSGFTPTRRKLDQIVARALVLIPLALAVTCAGTAARDTRGGSQTGAAFVEAEGGLQPLPQESTLPQLYRREGLISSNTYQVYVLTRASNETEAADLGLQSAKDRATELMMRERSLSSRLSAQGRGEIKRLVQTEGRVVRVHHDGDDAYVVVLQVYKLGLHKYLQKLN